MNVLIPQDIAAAGKEFLKKYGYTIIQGSGSDEASVASEAADSDAIIARAGQYRRTVIDSAPNLKVIARHGVGVDNVDLAYAEEHGIWVTNTPEALSSTVAEEALCLIFACCRRLAVLHQAVRDGNFNIRDTVKGMDIEGKTLGLIGLGRIGRVVAKKALLGLGMNVIAYDPAVADAMEGVGMEDSMESLLGKADVVSMHTPLNDATHHLMSSEEFSLMKPTAYFINTSRGGVVDEHALISALEEGKIMGAGLDVFDPEPPAHDNPIFIMDNVIVTPHSASNTVECMGRMSLHAAMSVHEVLSGRNPSWPVNNPENPRNGSNTAQ